MLMLLALTLYQYEPTEWIFIGTFPIPIRTKIIFINDVTQLRAGVGGLLLIIEVIPFFNWSPDTNQRNDLMEPEVIIK